MTKEIEKKYLIWENGVDYSANALSGLYLSVGALKKHVLEKGKTIIQGYLPKDKGWDLAGRMKLSFDFKPDVFRLRNLNGEKIFTVKGKGHEKRDEFEHKISDSIFKFYWPFTKGKRIDKKRLKLAYGHYYLEIDVFVDRDLIVGEIEVKDKKELADLKPIGMDVSKDQKYKNVNLGK